MKAARMKKAEHKEWLRLLDLELLAIGAEKRIEPPQCEGHVPVPHYTFETKAGPLVVHPEIPWFGKRHDYTCTVYGRFDDLDAGKALTGHWKWNAHYGPRQMDQLQEIATDYANRVLRLSALTPRPVIRNNHCSFLP